MIIETLRIENSQIREGVLEFASQNGYVLQSFNLMTPTVRDSMKNRPLTNGADDYTAHHGPRAVAFAVGIWGSDNGGPAETTGELLRTLNAFMHPSARSELVIRFAGETDYKRMLVRGQSAAAPLAVSTLSYPSVIVAMVCPSGLIEDYIVQVHTLSASAGSPTGRVYSLVFPRDYPDLDSGGANLLINNDGYVPSDFVLQIFGACTDPIVLNATTGQQFKFTGLALSATEYLEIDTYFRTIKVNGMTNAYQYLDVANSHWWQIQPGDNLIVFNPATYVAPSAIVLTYRPAYL